MDIEFGNGKNLLITYLEPEVIKKRGFNHPDPLFDELTYGEGRRKGKTVRSNVKVGSHILFHTSFGRQRYITGHFVVSNIMEGYDARHDPEIRSNYMNIHIHPESYPDWWGSSYNPEKELRSENEDIIIFGDIKKSLGKLEYPLPFDRELAEKLEFETTKIKFDNMNKRGRLLTDNECISSSTRQNRVITKNDVKMLLEEIISLNCRK